MITKTKHSYYQVIGLGLIGTLVAAAMLFSLDGLSPRFADNGVNQHVWPGETWEKSSFNAENIDAAAIEALVQELETGAYGAVTNFMLIRNGRVVADHKFSPDLKLPENSQGPLDQTEAETQYNYDHLDWHPYYRGTELHTMQSVTKSVTSAAFGIAVDSGVIPDIHAPAMPYFKNYTHDMSDPRKGDITIENLLTMRSGIEWNTEGGYGNSTHSTDLLESSEKWIQYILDKPMETTPGSKYKYI
ncbi:MAG: serine hydrolase, partial [Kordiimonadaceae bacterium]|nr:serine hydrolase [Kordiimonadaceae bacterium]